MRLLQPGLWPSLFTMLLGMLIWLVAGLEIAQAQSEPPPPDTKGKEFWVTFPASWGSGPPDLRLYLSCDRPTRATVTFSKKIGISFDLPVANVPLEINVTQYFDTTSELSSVSVANEISDKSFHIVADDDITLYGCTIRKYSSDAYIALPADVLKKRYIVLSYPNGYDGESFGPGNGIFDRPSQFAVVATEDSTTMRITAPPDVNLNGRPAGASFNVTLNQGEVFFAQASLNGPQDVSGAEIVADKAVAVFGSNMRTSIPTSVGNFRDYLIEQMPPMEAWGKEAILTPHYNVTPGTNYTAVARILAMFDDTEWTINGIPQPPLQRGKTVEIPLTDVMFVQANDPILIAQFEHSVGIFTDANDFALGDPFMMVIPPPKQYDTAYAFQSIITELFPKHYINVIMPSGTQASLRLDGKPVVATYFPVPETNFMYAQIEVSAGAHYIRADEAFGLLVYGYGEANSYGYVGGMLFRKLVFDLDPPAIQTTTACGMVEGVIYDNQFITDTGVDTVYVVDTTRNTQTTILPFSRGTDDTVHYQAKLVNPYQDGIVSIKVLDSAGHRRIRSNWIPGLTVGATAASATTVVPVEEPFRIDTLVSFNGYRYCQEFKLVNYGRFPHTFDSLWLSPALPGNVSIDAILPLTLNPGEQRLIKVCMQGWVDSVATVGIHVAEDCLNRMVATIPVMTALDTVPPGQTDRTVGCDDEVTISYMDGPARASGVAAITIDTLINCTAQTAPEAKNLPAGAATLRLHRLDPRRDMIYTISLVDDVGNSYTETDTIGGFTLAVTDRRSDTLAIRLHSDWDGDTLGTTLRRCDSIMLNNTGLRTLRIYDARMFQNLRYSIPPSQFPLSIPPGSSHAIAVCIEGDQKVTLDDTMRIVDECGNEELVAMKTPTTGLYGFGSDICNNALRIDQMALTRRTFLMTPVPNPVTGATAHVDVGLAQDEVVRLELIGSDGTPSLLILNGIGLNAGVSRVEFDTSELKSGAYFCRLTTGSGGMHVEKIVVNR